MGPTFAAFAHKEDAKAFAAKHGGRVLAFADVTPRNGRTARRSRVRPPDVSHGEFLRKPPAAGRSRALKRATRARKLKDWLLRLS